MHEVINTSLHSRKILTVPTHWDDDVSEIATACSQGNKFSPLLVLRRKKQESPKNFMVVRPAETSEVLVGDEERDDAGLEGGFFWEQEQRMEEQEGREPVVDPFGDISCGKMNPKHKVIDQSRQNNFRDNEIAHVKTVSREGTMKLNHLNTASKLPKRPPNKDDENTDAIMHNSIFFKSSKDCVGSPRHAMKNHESPRQDSAPVVPATFDENKEHPTYSFTRQSHGVGTKSWKLSGGKGASQTSHATGHDEEFANESLRTRPSVSASIVLRETGWPVMDWFKAKKMVIPVQSSTLVDETTDSMRRHRIHPNELSSDPNMERSAPEKGEDSQYVLKMQDENTNPFNQMFIDIWSSAQCAGNEILSNASAICASVGLPSLQPRDQDDVSSLPKETKMCVHCQKQILEENAYIWNFPYPDQHRRILYIHQNCELSRREAELQMTNAIDQVSSTYGNHHLPRDVKGIPRMFLKKTAKLPKIKADKKKDGGTALGFWSHNRRRVITNDPPHFFP